MPPSPKATRRRTCGDRAAAYRPRSTAGTASGRSALTASPAAAPAEARRSRPASRSNNREKERNARPAASTCAKRRVEKGSTSVERPRMTAAAVPRPGSIRSTVRRTSRSRPSAGRTTAHRPICQRARKGTPSIAPGYESAAFGFFGTAPAAWSRRYQGADQISISRRLRRIEVAADLHEVARLARVRVDVGPSAAMARVAA